MTEVCRRHADEILTRDATKHLIDELKRLAHGRQRADPQRDVAGRGAGDAAPAAARASPHPPARRDPRNARRLCAATKDPILLTEYVRHRLARQICTRYRNAEGELHVVALDPAMEDRIRAGFDHNERGLFIRMSPQAVEATCQSIAERAHEAHRAPPHADRAGQPANPRRAKQLTENHLPQLVVLSFNEVTRDTKIVTVGMVADGKA